MPNIDFENLELCTIPMEENGTFEFKSSQTPQKKRAEKITKAASAFANSGGGCFLLGIDDKTGNVDGGVEKTIGRQSIKEWVDQVIHKVEPTVSYQCRLFDDADGRGKLDGGKVVLALFFPSSELAPHMACDSRYYIRAGAHSFPASAFIVESLWARRSFRKPMLSHAVRTKPNNLSVIQIGVVALNSSPALNVEFNIIPLGKLLNKRENDFPIRLPVVDQNTPFFVDTTLHHDFNEEFNDEAFVTLKYRDTANNTYEYKSSTPLGAALCSLRIGKDPADKIVDAIKNLGKP